MRRAMQAGLALLGGSALLVATASGWAEGRRLRRRNLDAVGYVPWGLFSVLATVIGLFALAFAIVS